MKIRWRARGDIGRTGVRRKRKKEERRTERDGEYFSSDSFPIDDLHT